MRDAFGGVFMTKFLLVFIFVFVAFASVSLNYAKAYRVKNSVIDFLEQNEIIDFTSPKFVDKLGMLDVINNKANYNKKCNAGDGYIVNEIGENAGYCYKGIVILIDKTEEIIGTEKENIYYKVITFASWELGALNKILALGGRRENSEAVVSGTWTITGEAKVLRRKK